MAKDNYKRYPASGQPYLAPHSFQVGGPIAVWTWGTDGSPVEIKQSRIRGYVGLDEGEPNWLATDMGPVAWYDGEGFYVPADYLKKNGDLNIERKRAIPGA